MRDVQLANRLRAQGLRVVEIAGWQTRGSSSFDPRGSVNHHTAGSSRGACPSLNGVIHGHSGSAPGPLANVLQSREPDGNDIFYVVAAGRANHAGKGGWKGLSGNSRVYGLEIEHIGTTTLVETRQALAARCHAAFAGGRWDASWVCQHREWAPNRKIDAATGVDPNHFRALVAAAMGAAPKPPGPTPPVTPVGKAPRFPLPQGHWYGTPSKNPKNHSGYYSQSDARGVKTWQQQMLKRGWRIGVDGKFGPQSEAVCKNFQREKHLAVDGCVGIQTWTASWEAPVT